MTLPDSHPESMYTPDVFDVLFEYEVSRARRYPSPVALIEVEMQAAASEEALPSAMEIFTVNLIHHLRSVDIPAHSRNHFRIMLPTTSAAGARAVCERLISVFRNRFETEQGYAVAFALNIGASTHNGGASLDGAELKKKADEALQQSRAKGENTYVALT